VERVVTVIVVLSVPKIVTFAHAIVTKEEHHVMKMEALLDVTWIALTRATAARVVGIVTKIGVNLVAILVQTVQPLFQH
jgi:expansin (peptidoglycan-binding protein)